MYAIVMAAVMLALSSALALQSGDALGLMRSYRALAQRGQLQQLAEEVRQYEAERGVFPPDLATLAASVDHGQVASLLNNAQGYQLSADISQPAALSDASWTYQRMALFAIDPARGAPAADYLSAAENACGNGDFYQASSWCGGRRGLWYRQETRSQYNDDVSTARAHLRRTLQKLADYYSVQRGFPTRDNHGVALNWGQGYTLASLVGYSAGAASCSGIYSWNGIPLGCEDLYDHWGGAVTLAVSSTQEVRLVSTAPFAGHTPTPSGGKGALVIAAGFSMQ